MITESGSMSWMSPNMKMETVSGGGMKKMFGRMMSGDSAFQKALNQAKEIFNICPICKRLVCDHCFLICDDLDMCVQCAAKLNEKGTVVG